MNNKRIFIWFYNSLLHLLLFTDVFEYFLQLLRELIERKTSAVDPNDQVAMGRWVGVRVYNVKIWTKY